MTIGNTGVPEGGGGGEGGVGKERGGEGEVGKERGGEGRVGRCMCEWETNGSKWRGEEEGMDEGRSMWRHNVHSEL